MSREQQLAQVPDMERALLSQEVRADVHRLDALLADDFREIGVSGRLVGKSELLHELAKDAALPPDMGAIIALRWIGTDVAQLVFRSMSMQAGQVQHALRSSLWRLHDGRWQMFFHQGTRVPPG